MMANHNAAMTIAAFVTLAVVYSGVKIMHEAPPAPKGNKLTVSAPAIPAAPPVAEAPAATEPPLAVPEPVAAGLAPAETAPIKAVQIAKPIHTPRKVKRKIRRIARAKADPCVGPLCVMVR